MNTRDYQADERGYYGDFGGAFIPEMLYPNVEELRLNYLKVIAEPGFQEEFNQLLRSSTLPLPSHSTVRSLASTSIVGAVVS